MVRLDSRPGWDCPHPGPHWDRGSGLKTDTEAFVWHSGRHYTSQDASLRGPPSFPPTTPAAQLPPLFCQPVVVGEGSDVAATRRRMGGGRPHLRLSHGKLRRKACGSSHRLPSGPGPQREWADGAPDQNGHGPASSFPFQATKAPMWPPWPSLLSPWYPRVPLDLEVSPGASRSRPEIGQVTHLYPWLLQPPFQQALSPPGQGTGTALLQVLRCPGSPFAGSHLAGKEQAWAVNVA